MFWKNWSWPARILSVLGLGVVGVVLFPLFARSRGTEHRTSCQSNLKQIGLGVFQYTQDYDEKLPPVQCQGSAYGWADSLQPYLKSTQIFQCPQQGDYGQSDPRKSGYTDYVFDARMEKYDLKNLANPSQQILMIDGGWAGDVTDARYAFAQIPGVWFTDSASPLYRHKEAANYLFADGHVKGIKPSQIGGADQPVF